MSEFDGQGSKFFRDQNVFEEDLNNIEFTKIKLIRDTVKATMYSAGICAISLDASDLKVSVAVNCSTVAPGSAIDQYGRLIYVPSDTSASGSVSTDPYYHPGWPTTTTLHQGGNGEFFVHISYKIQEALLGVDDEGLAHNSRVYDSYEITISTNETSPNGGLLLAQYTVESSNIILNSLFDCRILYSSLVPGTSGVTGHQMNYH